MSLARIAAREGAYAAAQALNADLRHAAEYVAALDTAWRHRGDPTDAELRWLAARAYLTYPAADTLYDLALAEGLHDAAAGIAASIADRYPNVS